MISREKKSAGRVCVFICLFMFLFAAGAFAQSKKKSKEICITFDELPASRAFGEVDVEAINYLILQSLKNHEVKATGFVVGTYIEDYFDILGQWLNEGHALGNMTNTNQDFHQIDIKSFISDIRSDSELLEPMLSGFGQKRRFFRYPYLHYGTTVESKRAVNDYLDEHDIVTAHATVVVDDFLYNLTMEKIGKMPDSADLEQLSIEYLNHIIDEIKLAELKSRKILKRNCRQIIQFRANRINAILLDEILTAIKNLGYKFITLDRALKDKLYEKSEAYYGAHGLGYIDMVLQSDPDLLPAE